MKYCAAVLLICLVALPCLFHAQTAPQQPQSEIVNQMNLDSYIQVLRSNVRTQRMEIVAQSMHFNDKESGAFWPIYRNYELALDKLNDQKVVLIKDYAQNWENMTAAKAKALAAKSFDLEQQRTELKRKYFAEFEKAMPANRVAKFFQVDHRLDLLIDLQTAAQVPLLD